MRPRLDDLDDAGALLVYADALEEEGDPRGELCVVQHRLESAPEDRELREREAALFERYGQEWTGGFDRDGEVTLRWRRGFIDEAKLSLEDVVFAPRSLEAVLGRLLALPAAGLIRTIVIGSCAGDDYGGVAAALEAHPRPSLRALTIGEFDGWEGRARLEDSRLGDLSSLWPAVPNLERLVLWGRATTIGPLVLPRARSVALFGGAVPALLTAQLPVCEELIIRFGCAQGWRGDQVRGDDLVAVLDRADLPRLTTLRILHSDFTDEICIALAGSRVLRGLGTLDLTDGRMTHTGAHMLDERRAAFAHLALLDLTDNFLSSTAQGQVAGIAREVRR